MHVLRGRDQGKAQLKRSFLKRSLLLEICPMNKRLLAGAARTIFRIQS